MTILVALAHDEGVTVGADARMTAGDFIISEEIQKWWVSERGLSVGIAGGLYMGPVLADIAKSVSDPWDACRRIAEHLRHSWPPKEDEHGSPPWRNLSLLLTDGRSVWETGREMIPMPAANPCAVGSGYEFALGAMYAASMLPPERCVHLGIMAALQYNIRCGGEVTVLTIPKKGMLA